MGRVIHFEIPAHNPEKLVEFYKKVFSWEIQKYGEFAYWLVTTGPENEVGINGAILPKETEGVVEEPKQVFDAAHAINATITIDVPDLDESIKLVEQNGGNIVMEKWPVQGIGWQTYFQDPEMNLLGMMQSDPNAK